MNKRESSMQGSDHASNDMVEFESRQPDRNETVDIGEM